MRFALGVLLFAASFGVFAAEEKAKSDAKKIEGSWVIESATDDGKEDDTFKDVKITFEPGGKLAFQMPDKEKGRGTYQVDSSKAPKRIDVGFVISDFLITREGLYTLEKDVLTICLPAERNVKRPAKFDGSVGSKCWLWKLKRVK